MTLDLFKPVMIRNGSKTEMITTHGREPYPLIGYVGDENHVVEWRGDGR